MGLARLVFHPQNSNDIPANTTAIVAALTEAGFIANAFGDGRYFPGLEFTNLLTFLGCSPNIYLHPDENENFCHLIIGEITDTTQYLGRNGKVKPHCPCCKQKPASWLKINHWQQADALYRCEHCGSSHRMDSLNWRQQAGYGRFSLSVAHIYPHEAVPSEKLMQILHNAGNCPWKYFYATD
jgi:hypothetical protein